jgi:hypothetical protein
MKGFLRLGGVSGVLLVTLFACGKKLPTPPPPPPGQNDTTRVVLAEMFSAKNCQNCPLGDSAIHSLLANYGMARLIVVEYHPLNFSGPDSLGTAETDARCKYYGVSGYPTCLFDGQHKTAGPQDFYEAYHDSFEVESARRTPVVLGLTVSPQTGVATVKARALSAVPSPLVLQTVVISDSLYYRGPFQSWWRFVALDMIPDQNGDTLTLVPGDSLVTRLRSIVVQPGWNPQKLYVAAFVQNPANKEVLQSTLVKFIP